MHSFLFALNFFLSVTANASSGPITQDIVNAGCDHTSRDQQQACHVAGQKAVANHLSLAEGIHVMCTAKERQLGAGTFPANVKTMFEYYEPGWYCFKFAMKASQDKDLLKIYQHCWSRGDFNSANEEHGYSAGAVGFAGKYTCAEAALNPSLER